MSDTTKNNETSPNAGVPASGAQPAKQQNAAVQWERPASTAQARSIRSWLVFLGLISISVALWTPLRALYYQYGAKRIVRKEEVRDADSFLAIAYYGVNADALPGQQEISPDAFFRELRLLYEHNYTPITLKDVIAFYKEGAPLPRKAVLMTFEQSRRTSYFDTRNMLREFGWKAVMGVNTAPMHEKSAQTLLWPYINDMLLLGTWEIAAQSERGYIPIETSTSGQKGAFFSNPMWLAEKNRYELPAEFSKRIDDDHKKVIAEFKKEVGAAPKAFFFPYGDYGQYDERAHVIRTTNLHLVKENYDLGFILGQLALNTKHSDPRRLNRLLVNPEWSPETFITKLEAFWPKENSGKQASVEYDADAWIGEWGEVFSRNDELVLRAAPPSAPRLDTANIGLVGGTTGAKAWLAGSDRMKDGFLSLRFQHKRGRFGVYLRSSSIGEYLYFSLDEAGRVSIRQKLADLDELFLASDTLTGEIDSGHELLLSVRDNILFARLDGKTLFGGRVLLRGTPNPGLVGIGVWAPIPGIAETIVLGTRKMDRHDGMATWTPDIAKDGAYLSSWLNEHSYQFSVFSPPWLDIFENTPITFPLWDQKLLTLLAKSNGARIIPHIQVRDASLLLKIPVEEILQHLRELSVQGVYINTSSCAQDQITSLIPWLIRLNTGLAEQAMQLVLRLPISIESLPSAGNIIRLLPGVFVAGNYSEPPFELTQDHLLSLVSVPKPASEETLSLYYQISNMTNNKEDLSPDAMHEELRRKGFEAFASGAYPEAITNWTAWSVSDPRNAEPWSLVGDAWLRLKKNDKALLSFSESLRLNPGQIALAIRRARLLEEMGKMKDAAEELDTYVRAFPDNAELVIAQAQWLNRNRQHQKAREVMQSLVDAHPDNINARLVLQQLTDDPSSRYKNMKELLSIGQRSESMYFGFGRDIYSAELLALPESSVFFDFIRETAEKSDNVKTRELYESFLPLTNNIIEHFDVSKLSDNWITLGGFRPSTSGRYELRASTDMSEASLRLKKSELLRDAFLEVTLDESVGSFWIYSRRSSKAMIRFGYDDEGYIRLQAWANSEIVASQAIPWLRPPSTIRMRLEMRGDGALGYVNDKQVFMTPLMVPRSICYGWWSIAPFSSELGMARARISKIICGPLSPTLVVLPKLPPENISTILGKIRLKAPEISAISPVSFCQSQNGAVPETPEIDLSPYKMFCTFHRIRLMPMVDIPYFFDVKPEQLVNIININRLDGMVLRVRQLPSPEWFEKMQTMLEKTSADFILMQQEESFWPVEVTDGKLDAKQEFTRLTKFPKTKIREIPRGSLLLSPTEQTWNVATQPYQQWEASINEEEREGTQPNLAIIPKIFSEDVVPMAEERVKDLRASFAAKAISLKSLESGSESNRLQRVREAVGLQAPAVVSNTVSVNAKSLTLPHTMTTNLLETAGNATNLLSSSVDSAVPPPEPEKKSLWKKVKGLFLEKEKPGEIELSPELKEDIRKAEDLRRRDKTSPAIP